MERELSIGSSGVRKRLKMEKQIRYDPREGRISRLMRHFVPLLE